MIFNKLASLLGFASKAGRLQAGDKACEDALIKSKALLVLVDSRAASNTAEKFERICGEKSVPLYICPKDFETDRFTGKKGRRVFCVTDKGFAEAISGEILNFDGLHINRGCNEFNEQR